jgi:hypothetical protein
MVDPQKMCRKHLLGEHVECHMFAGSINKGISIKGYLDKGLLELHNLHTRHDELAEAMRRRGYKHESPLVLHTDSEAGSIDREANMMELCRRCPDCRRLHFRCLPSPFWPQD